MFRRAQLGGAYMTSNGSICPGPRSLKPRPDLRNGRKRAASRLSESCEKDASGNRARSKSPRSPGSVGAVSAVDVEDVTRDEPGFVRCDEDDAVGDLLGEAESTQRNLRRQGRLARWVSKASCRSVAARATSPARPTPGARRNAARPSISLFWASIAGVDRYGSLASWKASSSPAARPARD